MTFQPGKRVMIPGTNDSLHGTLIENINGTMGIQLDELAYTVTIEPNQVSAIKPLVEELQPAKQLG